MADLADLLPLTGANTFNVVVESPRGASVKLKYDPERHVMGISRPLPVGLVFPFDWGFVPGTKGMDDDPVDAMVLWDVSSYPGVVIECRAAAIIHVEQNKTNHRRAKRIRNDRIVGVPVASARQLFGGSPRPDRRVRQEIIDFLVAMTALEGKDIAILGWGGARDALGHIRRRRTSS